jgi:IS30 family transposase
MASKRKLTVAETGLIATCAKRGMAAGAIAKVVQRDASTVWVAMRRLGLVEVRRVTLQVDLKTKVADALSAAARRRSMSPAMLASELIAGGLAGSIDRTRAASAFAEDDARSDGGAARLDSRCIA